MARVSRTAVGAAMFGALLLAAACQPPVTPALDAAPGNDPDLPVASPAAAPGDGAAPATNRPPPPEPLPSPIIRDSGCGIVTSSGWSAHIDAMPGPGSQPRLIVSGTVGVKPASVTRIVLDPGVMESYPVQRTIIVEVTTPREPTIDMLVRREVRGEWPVTPPIGAITVRCGRTVLARIGNIVAAR